MAMIALAIKLESKGPVFYISKRAGRGYRVFNFIKFRTMLCGADKQVDQLKKLNECEEVKAKVFFKVSDDPRATRIGKFLRNTSLDELPQFFNVLVGDMSLVGNRPLPLYEASMLTTDEWSERFMAPAGITGLWQIRKKDRHIMTDEERIKLDITYSKKQNFLFDLWIIAHTPPALIQKSNAWSDFKYFHLKSRPLPAFRIYIYGIQPMSEKKYPFIGYTLIFRYFPCLW